MIQKNETFKRFFVEFLGVDYLNKSFPFYGTIVLKYYPKGNLAKYCYKLNKANKDNITSYNILKQLPFFESYVYELVDLAKQIAEGKYKKFDKFVS